ncbi:hypothetical protein IHE31_12640 [Mycetohabitans rhizoxinica]|uniref:hypothetical protein n=1 Tax=Mycetohabitans TaxID=2571159 RepID=UPI000311D09F|nr:MULTISPECIES: hypothetical protein [Mycetohabitans]MCF7696364.1 hypothetical protein [Mycetohabitans sp. B2]MCG1047697.1 hypothetical protein [Mycetohabitans sp. B6]
MTRYIGGNPLAHFFDGDRGDHAQRHHRQTLELPPRWPAHAALGLCAFLSRYLGKS